MIDLVCLANVMYNEARVDDTAMRAVAHVVMNRAAGGKNYCSVTRNGFASHNSAKKETKRWHMAMKIAQNPGKDLTNGATHFHTHAVRPSWSRKLKLVYTDKWHKYYK